MSTFPPATPDSTRQQDADSLANPRVRSTAPTVIQKFERDFHSWIDTINKLLQVAAIMVAGAWTWTVFQKMSAPNLETKFGVSTKLTWAPTSDGKHCLADFYVAVKNEGQSPFDVDGARVRGWLVDMRKHKLLQDGQGKSAYFDPNIADPKSLGHEDPFYDGVGQPIPQDLSTHYPPGTMEDSDATFVFENSPDTLVILRVDLHGHKSNGLIQFLKPAQIDDYSYEVDQVCGAKWASKPSQALP